MQFVKFDASLSKENFDCGIPALNYFIQNQASQFKRRLEAVIYCVVNEHHEIIGFYSLSSAHLIHSDYPEFLKKQNPHLPIPCALIGRLAVDKKHQGLGIGVDLLLHALKTVQTLSEHIGLAFVIVDAKNETAKRFYEKYGFQVLTQSESLIRLAFPVKNIPK